MEESKAGCAKCVAFTPPFKLKEGMKIVYKSYDDKGYEYKEEVTLLNRKTSWRERPTERFCSCPFCHGSINSDFEFWNVRLEDGFETTRWIEKFHSYGDLVLPDTDTIDQMLEEDFSETDKILEEIEEIPEDFLEIDEDFRIFE